MKYINFQNTITLNNKKICSINQTPDSMRPENPLQTIHYQDIAHTVCQHTHNNNVYYINTILYKI